MAIADFLTALSIFVAVGLGVWGFIDNRRSRRRANTVEFVGNFMLNDRIGESDFAMTRLINGKSTVNGTEIDDETDKHVIILLDYYEFLATAYAQGALDENVILHVRGGPMSRAFAVCEQYIADRRESLDAPNLYRNLENLVNDYKSRNLGL